MKVLTRKRKVSKQNKDGDTWVVDWYDFGKRRVKAFRTEREAKDFVTDETRKNRQRLKPTVNAHITLKDFVPEFFKWCRARDIRPRTIERYESALKIHLLPTLGDKRVRDLDRPTVTDLLGDKRTGDHESGQGQKGDDAAGRG